MSKNETDLVLGWKIDGDGNPLYWTPEAKAGYQEKEHLFLVHSAAMAAHTIIVAQSGSGKSFFLGRLLEELMMNTKAYCVVLDPNADFRRVHQPDSANSWTTSYDPSTRTGKLHTEKSQADFAKIWKRVTIQIETARVPTSETESGEVKTDDHYQELKIWWPSISEEILAEDTNPVMRAELYHCQTFVRAVADLLLLQRSKERRRTFGSPVRVAEDIYNKIRPLVEIPNYEQTSRAIIAEHLGIQIERRGSQEEKMNSLRYRDSLRYRARISRITSPIKYFSDETATFYFTQAKMYSNIQAVRLPATDRNRLTVIDMPSLKERSARFLAVYSRLALEWEGARKRWEDAGDADEHVKRVPTFIVLDEAHNLIPASTENKSEQTLRELFRTIAAEGRKFSIFLILVSQRPDKLDQFVISECENKAIMRLGSAEVVEKFKDALGMEQSYDSLLQQTTKFGVGKVVISGPWAGDKPEVFYAAARRTKEGGAKLLPEDWAVHSFDNRSPSSGVSRRNQERIQNKSTEPLKKDRQVILRAPKIITR